MAQRLRVLDALSEDPDSFSSIHTAHGIWQLSTTPVLGIQHSFLASKVTYIQAKHSDTIFFKKNLKTKRKNHVW